MHNILGHITIYNNIYWQSLLRFNTAPLGAVHAGGAGDLFPVIAKYSR